MKHERSSNTFARGLQACLARCAARIGMLACHVCMRAADSTIAPLTLTSDACVTSSGRSPQRIWPASMGPTGTGRWRRNTGIRQPGGIEANS
jgi:hypothetical protein